MSLRDEYPEAAQVFSDGGGDLDESLRWWMKATGQLPVEEGDLEAIVKRTQAHVGEVANIATLIAKKA